MYVNGRSFTPREATRLNENMEFPGITGPEVDALQVGLTPQWFPDMAIGDVMAFQISMATILKMH